MAEQQPVIVEDEDKQQETFSVQEKIDAGELVNPAQEGTVEDLPTEEGVPRLDIAPIRVKPRPEAGVGVTDGQIQIRPEVKFKTLKDAAEKSLEEHLMEAIQLESIHQRTQSLFQITSLFLERKLHTIIQVLAQPLLLVLPLHQLLESVQPTNYPLHFML